MKIPSRNINNNLGLDGKNENLISMEKLSNEMDNINYNQQNNNINSNNIQNNNLFPNDLLKSQNEDLNLSNINIEQTQKFVQNADFLFPEEESVNQNNDSNKDIHLHINNSNEKDLSKDEASQSISEEKRIEFANNLFGNSISFSMKSKASNDLSQSLVSEKRKELADELFRTTSNTSSKKKSLNETQKTNKTNISFAVNNLSGSNIGLNINEIANKYADKDKIIEEVDGQPSVACNSGRRNDENNNRKKSIKNTIKKSIKESIKESMNEYDKDIDEDEKISFKKNLIEFKNKSQIDINASNLKNITKINSHRKEDNNLIRNSNKNDLVSNSKEININNNNNNISMIDNENKNNNDKEKEKNIKNDNNIINNSNSEINLSNIDFENLPKFSNDKSNGKNNDKKIILKNKINAENYTKNNNMLKKPNFAELFKKSKNKNNLKINEEKKRGMIDKDNSDDEVSNDILNKKIGLTDENNESSIFNNNRIPSRISIDEDHSIIKDKNDEKNRKIELKKEKNLSINKEEEKLMESKYKFKEIKKKEIDSIKRNQKNLSEENEDNSFDNEKKDLAYFDDKFSKEKKFKSFLNENRLYFNEKIHDKEENDIQLKGIKENNYFENYICKQETVIDCMNKKKKKIEIPLYYDNIKKTYEENKNNFNALFQFVTEIDKKKLYDSYKKNEFRNISDYKISPFINNVDENIKEKIDYIRYTIDENYGDTFYRCFMFNLIENYILNKEKENLCMLIFDIFKLYDLEPSIYNSNKGSDIKSTLIFFSFLYDYIHLNMWEKVYFLYIFIYQKIEQVLISYLKYSIFLFLSQLYNDKINDNKYLYQYQKILINYNEPNHLIFQIIPFIFEINMIIFNFKNKEENQIEVQNFVFNPPKLINKNSIHTIYIIFQYNCYHIGYQKSSFDNIKEVLKFIKENLNKTSLFHYTHKGEIFCEKCDKNTEYIEIHKDNNKGVCLECLNSKIDEYLVKRISFINQDYKKSYINYSYYLRPIELILKKPDNSIVIKNLDYYSLNYKTFEQRISELIPSSAESINQINNINFSFDNDNNACFICQKTNNILTSQCGCKFCEDCLYEIFLSITNNKVILNGYEKSQLSINNNDKCPLCEKNINLHYLVMLFEEKGRNFEFEYNEAKIRMKNYCKTMCFDCQKKFSNEKSLEVSHNSQKLMLQIKVMINKHCFKDAKRNIADGIELEYEIDYSDVDHIVCIECYKRNRNQRIKRINDVEYKVIFCNICGIRHYSNMKEWDKWERNDICCKCHIF